MDLGRIRELVERLHTTAMAPAAPGLPVPARATPGSAEYAAEEEDLNLMAFRLEHCKDDEAVSTILSLKPQYRSVRFRMMTRHWLERTAAGPAREEGPGRQAA